MENKGPRILVIDDEQQIRRFLRVSLTSHGFDVRDVETGQEGLDEVARFRPDVVILDLGLPDIDGQDVVRLLREWSKVPIIILSAKVQDFDKIAALDSGADDYVTKPFSMGELLARIRASLRHTISTNEEPTLRFDDLSIDFARRHVKLGETEVKLTPTEYDIVKHLAVNAGKVLTHQFLLRTVWGSTHEDDNQYIRVYMRQLRRKLEKDPSRPRHIITEPGVGYRLL